MKSDYLRLAEAAEQALMEQDFPFGVDTSSWLPNPTKDESNAMRTIRTRELPSKRDYIKWYKQDNKVRSPGGRYGGVGGWMMQMRNREIDKEAPEKYELAKSGWNKQNAIHTTLFDTPITVNGRTYQNRSELLHHIRRYIEVEDEIQDSAIDEEKKTELIDKLQEWKDFMFDVARRAPANCELAVPLPKEIQEFQSMQ